MFNNGLTGKRSDIGAMALAYGLLSYKTQVR